jgi:hypothetical protein
MFITETIFAFKRLTRLLFISKGRRITGAEAKTRFIVLVKRTQEIVQAELSLK